MVRQRLLSLGGLLKGHFAVEAAWSFADGATTPHQGVLHVHERSGVY